MAKTTIFSLIVVISILGVIAWLGRSATSTNAKLPVSVDTAKARPETYYDFGSISMKAGVVSHDFIFTNDLAEPLAITQIYTSCMCTTASIKSNQGIAGPFGMPGHGLTRPANIVLAAGEAATIKVTFNPAAHGPAGIGSINRTVTLEGSTGKLLELAFSAVVTP